MAQSLELLILQFLMPDNEARRQVEDQIKRMARDPDLVPVLIDHIRTAKTPNVRQLSAVLLRKKITGHWAKLLPDVRRLVVQSLIESIATENSSSVRRASANAASIIAKYAVPSGQWPELLPFVFHFSQSTHEDQREVALMLFSSLTERIGDSIRPYFANFQLLLLKCLQDEISSVRVAALKAVGAFLEVTRDDSEVVKFCDFIPSILNISRQYLASGEEDIAMIAFEIFDELIEFPGPLLGESMKAIVHFSLEAIQIISWLAKYQSTSLKEQELIVPILHIMCPMLTEMITSKEDDDLSPDRAVAEVLDTMSVKLPSHLFPFVFEFASECSQSLDLKFREASVMILGLISEGCSELMKENLQHILYIVFVGLRDTEPIVRGAASFALGQFAEYLQPEIISHYETVLPHIFRSLQDASDDVKEKSYYALAALCENMGEKIIPFIDPLMGILLAALQNSPRKLHETCLSAISSVASATEKAFLPYVETVLQLMKSFMVLTNDEYLRSRARATELLGIAAMIAGKEKIEPILPPFIEAAISVTIPSLSPPISYIYLPHVVPLAFSSCNLDDGFADNIDDSDEDEDVIGFDAISSDDESQDEPRARNINIKTGVLDEKAAAIQALGLFALHTKSAYEPYWEESLRIMVKHSIYFHEDVRLQAMTGLKHTLSAVHACLQGHDDGASHTKQILDSVMKIYIKTMNEDDDMEVVAQACMCVAQITKDFGYIVVESRIEFLLSIHCIHHLFLNFTNFPNVLILICFEISNSDIHQLVESTLVLLWQKSTCQQVKSGIDIEYDVPRHSEMLMDAVTDLLPAFSKAMGSNFAPFFEPLFDPLMEFLKGSDSPQDRTMVVACLAEVAQHMGTPFSGYVNTLMPLVLRELDSPSATNRRNAAFCVGEFCKNGGEYGLNLCCPLFIRYFDDVLPCIYPLFEESEEDHAVRDNAAGAIAKMITAHRNAVPLYQVLPMLLKVLPLKEDHEESVLVYSCICNLVLSSNSQILDLVPDLVTVFAQVAISPLETREVKLQIGGALSHLLSVFGRGMKPVLRSIPPTHASALAAILP
ncbi:hypothetical protein L2E82_24780 [Cichorium intybus]|uniref:Uncharacterized protein n=1 Tax=Cichorium intybus TaxID=13427 RepID=A0ACB9E275_CICIN|nr:hypothetical protein L2E82_24780 [Cichorium intybus]